MDGKAPLQESAGRRPGCDVEAAPAWLGVVATPGPCPDGRAVWLTDGFEPWATGGGFVFTPCARLSGPRDGADDGVARPIGAETALKSLTHLLHRWAVRQIRPLRGWA
jgi:hypothetical protein